MATRVTIIYNIDPASGTAPIVTPPTPGSTITLDDGSSGTYYYTGHYLSGWTYNGTTYSPGASFTVPDVTSVTFTAVWATIKYTVSYYANGGSGTTPSSSIVDAGTIITTDSGSTLYRTDYTLNGWRVNGTGGDIVGLSSSYTVNSNVTFYAYWVSVPTYTLSLYSSPSAGGSTSGSGTYKAGVDISISASPSTGYEFNYWGSYVNCSVHGTSGQSEYVKLSGAGNASVTAYFKTKTYTITYEDKDSTSGSAPSSGSVSHGNSYTLAGGGTLARTGYVLSGWRLDNYSSGTIYSLTGTLTNVTGNHTMYPYWTEVTYKVGYYANGGTGTIADQYYAAGTVITLSDGTAFSRTDYNRKQWRLNGTGGDEYALGGSYTVPSYNSTFYMEWESIPKYELTLISNPTDGGTTTGSGSYSSGVAVDISASPNDGYGWLYWDNYVNCSVFGTTGQSQQIKLNGQGAASVRANFSANTITCTFVEGDYGTASYTSKGYVHGSQYGDLPTVTADTGYVFNGWYTASSGGTKIETSTVCSYTSAFSLYAQYSTVQTYTVTVTQPEHGSIYKGSSLAPSSETVNVGTQITYTATQDSGYEFDGWTLSGGGSISSTSSTTTTLTVGSSGCTLTCSFTPSASSVYVVTSVYGGGDISLSASVVAAGTPITYTTAPTSVNSTLDSVELIAGSATITSTTITPTTNCEVRAVFKRTSKVTPTATSTKSKKYKLLVYNYGYDDNVLLTMNGNGNTWFTDLKFSKKINEIGSGSFTLYSKSSYDVVGDKIDIGSHIIVLQDNYPVYYGYITDYNKDDINFYGDHSYNGINQYTITFNDILRELNYESNPYNSQVITGTPKFIMYAAIGGSRRLGNVYSSNNTISFTISKQNRLSLLDNLSDQIGWRYKSHAQVTNVIPKSYITSAPVSGTSGTLTFSTTVRNSGDRVIISNGDSCHIYTIYPASESSFSFTNAVHTDNVALGSDAVAYFMNDYVIDFAPSFFQSNSIVNPDTSIPSTVGNNKAWGINYKAKDVKSDDSVNTQYGSVSITSTQGNGSSYTAEIPLKQIHNVDYTFNNSSYVKQSCDYYCCDWDWQPSYSSSYGRLYFDVYGSDVPLSSTPFSYSSYLVLIDRVSNKCQIFTTPSNRGDNGTNNETGIPITHLYFDISTNDSLYTRLESGDLEPYLIMSDYYILQDTSMNGITSFYIGGESGTGTISSNQLYINRGITSGNYYAEPKVHTIGTLVIKNETPAVTGSPYNLYPSRTLFGQMQSGSSYMDVDLVASSFAVFGSNFDSNGTANVSLPFFVKDDASVDMIHGLPDVGDHIAFYDSSKSDSSAISDYELLSYELDVNTLSNKIKYGTYAPTLGSTLYNLRKNTTTNIVRG